MVSISKEALGGEFELWATDPFEPQYRNKFYTGSLVNCLSVIRDFDRDKDDCALHSTETGEVARLGDENIQRQVKGEVYNCALEKCLELILSHKFLVE